MPRSRVIAPSLFESLPANDLAASLSRLSAIRDRDQLMAAVCEAAGRLLELDAVAVVRLLDHGIECEGRWSRQGARPNRVGEARMMTALELASDAGGVAQRTFGRLQLVAIPVTRDGVVTHMIAATAAPGRLLSDGDRSCAHALGVHTAACLEMLSAIAVSRDLGVLEHTIAPPAVEGRSRGDRALEQMQLLLSLAGAFTATHSLSEVGQIVVSQLRTLIDYHSCRFYVVTPDGQSLLPAALNGVGPLYEGENADDLVCQVGEGITGNAFVDCRPLRIDDANAVEHALEIPGTDPIDESMLVAPMVTDRGAVGVIVLSKEGLARFDDDDLRLLEVIAAQAATACDRVRLHSSQAEAVEVAEALLELGAALALQGSVEGIASMLAVAIDRLVECAAISVWTRQGDQLAPAAALGLTPREQQRLMALRLTASAGPLALALESRRSPPSRSSRRRRWRAAWTPPRPAPPSRWWRSASAPPTGAP